MSNRITILLGAVTLIIFLAQVGAAADPASWSTFEPADFQGIWLSCALSSDHLNYMLTLGSQPKITISGITYNVNWVQAFFVVSESENKDFAAENGTVVTDWMWEKKGKPGAIAGWHGEGNDRIDVGKSKLLGFASFNIDGNSVLSGIHVGYQVDSTEVSGWYKDTLMYVPEPCSILVLGTGVAALLTKIRLRAACRRTR